MATSSDSDGSVQNQPRGRQIKNEFVWLQEKRNSIPRGNYWDQLNRTGKVKEISLTLEMREKQVADLVKRNFPGLSHADLTRIRVYKSFSRGSKMQRVFCGIPDAKTLKQIFTKPASRRVYLYLKSDTAAQTRHSTSVANIDTGSDSVDHDVIQPDPTPPASQPNSTPLVTLPSLNPTPPAPQLNPALPAPQITPAPTAPQLNPAPPALQLNPASPATQLNPAPPGPQLIPAPPAPQLNPAPPAPQLNPAPPATQLNQATPAPQLNPAPPATQLNPATPAPQLNPAPPVVQQNTLQDSTLPRTSEYSGVQHNLSIVHVASDDDDNDLLHNPFDDRIVEVEPVYQEDHLQAIITEPPETAGVFEEDLSPLGIIDLRKEKVPLMKMDRIQEVLLCERELMEDNFYKPLPVFVNLSFDEMCHQGRADEHMLVCVVIKEGDDLNPVRRLLSLLEIANETYFWIAKSGTKSAIQVTDKFGSNSQGTEVFILAPTTARPVLIERYSGETLRNVEQEELMNAIQQGSNSLEGLRNERERVKVREEQDKEFKESLRTDRKKSQTEVKNDDIDVNADKVLTIREDRRQRVTPEPEEGTKIVLRFWKQKLSRKFKQGAMFQEVYDWVGAMHTIPLHFTLQRRSQVVLHEHPIEGQEVLDIYEREEEEVKSLLNSQVSFRGNLPNSGREELDVTIHGGELKDEIKEESSKVKGTKQKKSTRKEARKEKGTSAKNKKELKKRKKENQDGQKRAKKHADREKRDDKKEEEEEENDQVQQEDERMEKKEETSKEESMEEQQQMETESKRKKKKEKRSGSQRKKFRKDNETK